MNPRQRRGVLLLALATLGAVAVFVAVAGYVADVRGNISPTVTVLRLAKPAPANQPITADMVRPVSVPERWAPPRRLSDPRQLLGMVAGTELPAGALLQHGMVVRAPELQPGQRELAILVNAETGVAGKVAPGDVVDIQATFAATEQRPARSQVVVASARVIEVGLPTRRPAPADAGRISEEREVVPVTFALEPRESLKLGHAASFAEDVRLALIRRGDAVPLDAAATVYSEGHG